MSQIPGSQPPVSVAVVSGSVTVSVAVSVFVVAVVEVAGDVALDVGPLLDEPDEPDEFSDDTPGCE